MDNDKIKEVVVDISTKMKEAAFMGDFKLARILSERLNNIFERMENLEDALERIYRFK